MNIRSLRYFLKVAEYSSITRAAADLHLTQPALTRHIAQLEEEFRVKILMRHGRGVRLTEAGRLLAERAAAIISQIEDLSDELEARERNPQGALSVGMPYAFSALSADIIARFRDLHPQVRLRLIIDTSESLEGMLKSRYIDAAVLTMIESDPEIESRPIVHDKMYLFGQMDSDLGKYSEISLAELSRRPMIRPHNATMALKRMGQRLARHGLLSGDTVIETSASLMLDLVEKGLGFAAMPGLALTLNHGNVRAVPIAGLTHVWTFGRLKTRPRTAAVDAYEALLKETVKAKVASGELKSATVVHGV